MDYEIVWTESAAADLEAIVRYLARRNATAAESVRTGILDHVETLSRFPLIGPVYERERSGRTREIVYRSYRIFYRVEETAHRVEILTVWHGARGEPRLPNGLGAAQ
jgi:plasmid stabilization system protein ParE